MINNMNIGDYVRTSDGFIGKITSIENKESVHLFQRNIYTDNYKWLDLVLEENIVKSSPNIIDLIQVKDYVNGSKVIDIDVLGKNKEKWVWVERMEDDDYVGYNNEQIKSIVTKEQFKAMKYEVGDK